MGETALQVLGIGGGVAGGGAILIWFTKLMAARLIKQYDDKHKEHDQKIGSLSERLAVLDHVLEKTNTDLDRAHCKIRNIEKELDHVN